MDPHELEELPDQYRVVRNATPGMRPIGLFLGRIGNLFSFLDEKTSGEIVSYMTRNRLDDLLIQIVNGSGNLATTNGCGNLVPCEIVVTMDNFKYVEGSNDNAMSASISYIGPHQGRTIRV